MKSAIVFAAITLAVLAHSPASFAVDDPGNAKAPVPPVRYQSPFRDYRLFGEDKLIPWKAANDEVRTIGGWRTYAREAREVTPAAPAAVAPAPATSPASSSPTPAKPSTEPPLKREPVHSGHDQHK